MSKKVLVELTKHNRLIKPSTIQEVSLARIIKVLRATTVENSHIISFTDCTEFDKNCPYQNIKVLKKRRVRFKMDYEEAVNRQRKREGKSQTFEALPRSWGTHIEPPFLVHNKDGQNRLYVAVHVMEDEYAVYYSGESPILDSLDQWRKPQVVGRQNVDKPVVYRNYLIQNILAYTVGSTNYVVDLTIPVSVNRDGDRLKPKEIKG